MPEICEIALTSEILNDTLKGMKLKSFKIVGGKYLKKSPTGYDVFKKKLPLNLKKISSQGKFMWFEFDENHYIFNTFGVYGKWSFEKHPNPVAKLTFVDEDDDSNDTKEIVVWYMDQLNFGTFKFTTSKVEFEKKLKTLGPDYLKDEITFKDFKERMKKVKDQNKQIVKVLMHQKWIGSGLGNYLVPEILYRAKISPHRAIKKLENTELKLLYNTIIKTVKMCYMNNPPDKYIKYLVDQLDNHKLRKYLPNVDIGNKEFKFLVYGQKKDPHGNEVITDKIVDKKRNTYWVPKVQV